MLTWDDLAFTILAEVSSFYPGRGDKGSPEILIGAGCIALGREPCKAYNGWGMVSPWNRPGIPMPTVGPEKYTGWYVSRVSQEHGVLGWRGDWTAKGDDGVMDVDDGSSEGMEVGRKIRIWPNHACIAGVGFSWYFVIDGGREGREDEIVDIWPRWRGW